jgi:hypothetical protein
MKTSLALSLTAVCALALSAPVRAQVFAQWDFNSNPGDAATGTGILTPRIGAGSLTLVGGTTSTFASGAANGGSTDPNTTDDSGLNVTTFAAQGAENKARGVQFNVSTVGVQDISVSWDHRHSNTASEYVTFQYSTDGSTFIDFANFQGMTGDTWFNGRSVNLSAIPAVDNNASFAFRIVQSFGPGNTYEASNQAGTYAAAGTWRFDMVTINATPVPEPEEYAAMVAGGLFAFAVWRRRQTR